MPSKNFHKLDLCYNRKYKPILLLHLVEHTHFFLKVHQRPHKELQLFLDVPIQALQNRLHFSLSRNAIISHRLQDLL